MSSSTVHPVRIRYHSDDLGCDGSRIVGYRKRCECGKPSPVLSSVQAARAWVAVHRARGHRD